MKRITEDYCSFEIAKLLKEKGFDEDCWCWYEEDGYLRESNDDFGVQSNSDHVVDDDEFSCSAPTIQMAMKWLREKGIYITIVYGDYPSLNKVFYTPQIDSLEGFDLPIDFYKEYDKYEEAEEAGIKYALENLI